MGAAKAKKIYNQKVNRSVWILYSMFGIIDDQFDVIDNSSKHELSQEDKNKLTVIRNLLTELNESICCDENKTPYVQKCSEETIKDYNYFYLEMQKKIDELNNI